MVSQKHRVNPSWFYKNGGYQTLHTPLLVLKHKKNNLPYNRFATVIKKGAVRRSVDRHVLKRLFLAEVARWPSSQEDIVCIFKTIPQPIKKESVKESIRRAKNMFLKY